MSRRLSAKHAIAMLCAWVAALLPLGSLHADELTTFERSNASRPDQSKTDAFQDEHTFKYALPSQPPPQGPKGDGDASGSVLLTAVMVTGNVRVSDADIATVTTAYVGHRVTVEDLSRLRDDITKLYVARGYISSGAVLPTQDVSSGIVRVEVVEGTLENVSVEGNRSLDVDYLLGRFGVTPGDVVDVHELENRFRAMLDDPSIKQVDIDLRPGTTQGKATVVLKVQEADRYIVQVSAADDRSPSTGGNRGSIQAFVRNALFSGDDVTIDAGLTQGSEDGHIGYAVPLTASGLTFTATIDYSHAKDIEKPVNELDIISDSFFGVTGLSYPVFRENTPERSQRLTVSSSVAFEHSETSLSGAPFSFSPGADHGVTDYWTADAGAQYSDRRRNSVLAASLDLTMGLHANDPDVISPDTPDEHFWLLSGRLQYVRELNSEGLQAILRADGQYTDGPLFVPAKYAAGGLDSVRGYRKNRALGDSGITLSAELQKPILSSGLSPTANKKDLSLFVFTDRAYLANAGQTPADIPRLWGAGAGIAWTPMDWASLRLTYAHAIEKVPDPSEESLQDRGLYFELTMRPSDIF